jgi:hypothetical protein
MTFQNAQKYLNNNIDKIGKYLFFARKHRTADTFIKMPIQLIIISTKSDWALINNTMTRTGLNNQDALLKYNLLDEDLNVWLITNVERGISRIKTLKEHLQDLP